MTPDCYRVAGNALRHTLLITTLACSSAVEPPPTSATLFVRNATCDAGPCQPIRVLAFPDKQPLTPGGAWSLDLGVITGSTACLTIPASASFRVTNAGTGDVTTTTWTTRDALSLAPWPASEPRFMANPTTPAFVAGNASSWSVTLPGATAPVAARDCTP